VVLFFCFRDPGQQLWCFFLLFTFMKHFSREYCSLGDGIRIIFHALDPGSVLGCLGSRSIRTITTKLTGRESLTKYAFLVGSCWTCDRENQVKMYKKVVTVLGTLPLWNGKDPDPYKKALIRNTRVFRIRIRIEPQLICVLDPDSECGFQISSLDAWQNS
jgi:hypothetical protein